MCNAPIPATEEALDSFDESPEIKQEANVQFVVGDSLLEVKEDDDRRVRTVSFTSSSAKVGALVTEVDADIPIAMSHTYAKPDADVTIVVEDDEC